MIYDSGTATDEQDLVGVIHTFLTSTIGGWTRIGIITDTASDKDYVYFSNGEVPGLYRDMYIRVRGYSNYVYLYGYSYWSAGSNDGELHNASYSLISVGSSSIDYWFFGDRDHFWIVAKNGSDYYYGGAGYLDSYYSPSDNDFPLAVIGHSSISYGLADSTKTVGYSAVTSGTNVILKAENTQTNLTAFGDPNLRDGSQAHTPAVMYCSTAGHQEVQGELRGVLMFSGVTLTNEDWVTISGTDHKFFIARYSDSECVGFGPIPV